MATASGGFLDRRAVLASAAVLLALVARTPSFLHQLFDPDEASIATQAITMQRGGSLYVNTIDRKPPLPPLLYEWSFDLFGPSLIPLHVVAGLALGIAAAVLGLDLRDRLGGGAGWWGVVLMVTGAIAFLPTNAQAANYSHFALLPGALAVVWARRPALRWSLLAGVALGLAILCRQTWAIGLIPGVVAIVFGSGSVRSRAAAASGFLVTTAGTVAAAVAFVPAGPFWHWVFAGNQGFITSPPSATLVWRSFLGNVAQVVGFHLAIVAGLSMLALWTWRRRALWDFDLWLWVATGVVAALAGFRFFGHYWLQCLPPAVLLVAPVLARARSRWIWPTATAVAVPTAVAVGLAFVPNVIRDLSYPRQLVAFVKQHSGPHDPVLVWGNDPVVLWQADRPMAGAFVSSDFVVGLSGNRTPGQQTLRFAAPGARVTMMAQLRRHRPVLVVDTSTANIHDYAVYPMSVFPQLHRFVELHYRREAMLDGVSIYVQRRCPGCSRTNRLGG